MKTIREEQQDVKDLVKRITDGDLDAFLELEELARPLTTSLSDYFSSLHYKFEFEDFYSICRNALYEACFKYNPDNPSFLSYAKSIMKRKCWRELEYWNAEMRNIFVNHEVSLYAHEIDSENDYVAEIQLKDDIVIDDIVESNEFSENIKDIIFSIFEGRKAEVMFMFIVKDMTPKEISRELGLHYQNVYAIIRRGKDSVVNEYKKRYNP